MKNFLRSVAGKTVLFVLVAIMFAAAAVSAASVVFLTLNGFYDEKTDVESAGDRMRGDYFSRYVQQDAYSAAFAVLTAGEEPYTPDSLQYSLYDETGNLISTNHDASVPETGDFWDYRVYIWKNETFLRVSFYDDPTEIGEKYVFCASPSDLREGYFGVDRYSRTANLISLGYSVRYIMIAVLAVSASLLLAAFVTLMCFGQTPEYRRDRSRSLEPRSVRLACVLLGLFLFVCLHNCRRQPFLREKAHCRRHFRAARILCLAWAFNELFRSDQRGNADKKHGHIRDRQTDLPFLPSLRTLLRVCPPRPKNLRRGAFDNSCRICGYNGFFR